MKTLLIVMTVAIVAFGVWVQYMRQRAQENRERVAAVQKAKAAIEELGGTVASTYEKRRTQTWLEKQLDDPGGADDPVGFLKIVEVQLYWSDKTTANDLEHLKLMKDLNALHLSHTPVTDAGLEHLKGLTNLGHLGLSFTKVTDAGLEHLQGLTKLSALGLEHTKVTGAGLEHLKELPQLRNLFLSYTDVADTEHLGGLTNLEYLMLDNTRVTDAGLEHLDGLTNLQRLYLSDTNVTDAGVAKLQQALPNCEIFH
ncbi:MAG: hypothetical protein IID44_18015 [Planctomycetes bacterium]|nr:hypothetical protein [Planctomycetota bacterium]